MRCSCALPMCWLADRERSVRRLLCRPAPPGSSHLWQAGSSSFLFAVASKLWIVNRTKLTLMPNSDYYEIPVGANDASDRTTAQPAGGDRADNNKPASSYVQNCQRPIAFGCASLLYCLLPTRSTLLPALPSRSRYTLQILTGQRDLRLKLRSEEDVAHSAHLEAAERSRSEAHAAVVEGLAATFAATGEFLSLKTPWSEKLEVRVLNCCSR